MCICVCVCVCMCVCVPISAAALPCARRPSPSAPLSPHVSRPPPSPRSQVELAGSPAASEGSDGHSDFCMTCGNGGELLLCEGCVNVAHHYCWYSLARSLCGTKTLSSPTPTHLAGPHSLCASCAYRAVPPTLSWRLSRTVSLLYRESRPRSTAARLSDATAHVGCRCGSLDSFLPGLPCAHPLTPVLRR